jgi:hypothetical protein
MKDDHSEGLARGIWGLIKFAIAVVVIVVVCIVISKLK